MPIFTFLNQQFCQYLSFLNIFFDRFCPIENCEVTSHCLHYHCMKSVRIRSFSGPYFAAFGLEKLLTRTLITQCTSHCLYRDSLTLIKTFHTYCNKYRFHQIILEGVMRSMVYLDYKNNIKVTYFLTVTSIDNTSITFIIIYFFNFVDVMWLLI